MNKRLTISPVSKQRRGQMKQYGELRKSMDKKSPFFCWFCGEQMKKPEDHHHVLKRDGEFYLAKEHLYHCHRSCHNSYHFDSLQQLLKESWYVRWLNFLPAIYQSVKRAELNKFEKNNLKPEDYGIRNV